MSPKLFSHIAQKKKKSNYRLRVFAVPFRDGRLGHLFQNISLWQRAAPAG